MSKTIALKFLQSLIILLLNCEVIVQHLNHMIQSGILTRKGDQEDDMYNEEWRTAE
jgi:hypothetical protein